MVELNWILFVFISLSLAEFAIQMVISELSTWIRGAMRLTIPYPKRLDTLCNPILWRKSLGRWWFIASPLIFLICIHKFFAHLFSCPYCIGYHLAWVTLVFVMGIPILYALLLAPITLVFVALLDKLHSY